MRHRARLPTLAASSTKRVMRHDDHLFPILPEPHRVTPGRPAARHGRAAIAIGAANGANPIAIVVPCHRVIGTSGDLKSYAWGLHRKRWLLEHEQAIGGRAETARANMGFRCRSKGSRVGVEWLFHNAP